MRTENPEKQIAVGSTSASGIQIASNYSGMPSDGVLDVFRLMLPDFTRACYFSQDELHKWPAGANRILPWALTNDMKALFKEGYLQDHAVKLPSRNGAFALFELTNGDFLAILPLVGDQTMSWLYISESADLELHVGSFGTASVESDVPLVAWARSRNIYTVCRDVWSEAIGYENNKGATAWRKDKRYPTPFCYLGWCSWAQYKTNIDSSLLTNTADAINASDLPIRWMLIDGGHQTAEDQKLKSLAPDKDKFPAGWQELLAKHSEGGLKWFGLWHCYFGLWNGVHPENDLGSLNEDLVVRDQALFPGKDEQSARRFYDALIGSAKQYGFDFVKVDVQATYLQKMQGMPNPVQMNTYNAQGLEEACECDMDGLINCMSHNSMCVFNTRYSVVTRCSIDYKPNNEASAKSHLRQSYCNSLWMGQTVWPDHDMFHSSDVHCGRMMAVSKALSGAPVYLSDDPGQFKKEYVRPLTYEDGELLRPLAPAAPLPDSVFVDALNEPIAYRVIAPLPNRCAAVALYNLMEPTPADAISAKVIPDDYSHASGMLQPYPGPWPLPNELVVYDCLAGKGAKLDSSYELTLQGFTDSLLILCPVSEGWAVIGRADKYLSPAAVESVVCTHDCCQLTLVESGPVVIWLDEGIPGSTGDEEAENLGKGFWRFSLPMGVREYTLTLLR